MGIHYQFIFPKTSVPLNLPVPSARIAQLFYEFLRRYYEWKSAKIQEMIGMFILLAIGAGIVSIPWVIPNIGMVLSLGLLALFYFAAKHYLRVNERACHLYVNVHILHHHLIGKLEVGFCDHREPCHCVEEFLYYVSKNYKIDLNKSFLT
ncbi:hypothetical protein REC12_20875 [Desulfosporosinus sp. PR]|uniref:hypothetical protein n=1 Tax=Candidatus Desulfosporosinus nitrosoreducens TaxID=3401928 RepID=UPI0027E63A0A|nr:hypothetical protein [Desulfosporosinus sp. PR]MDQ7096054.1 hypothetical protein [Desulfosporosinus sp. PR]